jgi:hypothetical protein
MSSRNSRCPLLDCRPLSAMIRRGVDKWAKVIKETDIKLG